jgi:hypothetical protein
MQKQVNLVSEAFIVISSLFAELVLTFCSDIFGEYLIQNFYIPSAKMITQVRVRHKAFQTVEKKHREQARELAPKAAGEKAGKVTSDN